MATPFDFLVLLLLWHQTGNIYYRRKVDGLYADESLVGTKYEISVYISGDTRSETSFH